MSTAPTANVGGNARVRVYKQFMNSFTYKNQPVKTILRTAFHESRKQKVCIFFAYQSLL